MREMVDYAFTECVPGKLSPDGWAAGIWAAAERGDIPPEKPPLMMNDYMGPSLDTTIFATANMIWLFATHPEQWALLRQQPDLMLNAINEVLRIETVIQGFSRVLTEDHSVDGTTMPAGSRGARAVRLGQPGRAPVHGPGPLRHHPGEHVRSTSASASAPTRARAATWPAWSCEPCSPRSCTASSASSSWRRCPSSTTSSTGSAPAS